MPVSLRKRGRTRLRSGGRAGGFTIANFSCSRLRTEINHSVRKAELGSETPLLLDSRYCGGCQTSHRHGNRRIRLRNRTGCPVAKLGDVSPTLSFPSGTIPNGDRSGAINRACTAGSTLARAEGIGSDTTHSGSQGVDRKDPVSPHE